MTKRLVIEDDDRLRTTLRKMLERSGYEVVVASNGKEGIKHFREAPCDLVITDLIMPEKEGLETIRELKEEVPDIKVIAISGGGREGFDDSLRLAKI
jgi:DNA-binding response OmpR family regulator